jgi:hypothetical protein
MVGCVMLVLFIGSLFTEDLRTVSSLVLLVGIISGRLVGRQARTREWVIIIFSILALACMKTRGFKVANSCAWRPGRCHYVT